MTEGSRVQGFLEPVCWQCIGSQVKDGSHVVIWTACTRTHNQNETSCGFRLRPPKSYMLAAAIASFV